MRTRTPLYQKHIAQSHPVYFGCLAAAPIVSPRLFQHVKVRCAITSLKRKTIR